MKEASELLGVTYRAGASKNQYHLPFIYSITSISNCLNIGVSASVNSKLCLTAP